MAGRHRATASRQGVTAGRSHLFVPAACGLLLVAGLASGAIALGQPTYLPDLVPTPPHQTQTVPPSAPASIATASPEAVNRDVEPPVALSIPAIGVVSQLIPLGLNIDGSLEVPARGPLYDQAAWYTGSPSPGQDGPAVLLGHVNGRGGVPSVFFRLAQLSLGDRVTVDRADGSAAVFEVYLTEQFGKGEFPTAAVYGNTEGPELRLITCAGTWDAAAGHYRDNAVVFARLLTTT